MKEINKLVLIEDNFNSAIQLAIQIYDAGGVFVYPTDTIYGLGGNPFDERTIKKINEIKGRIENQKFIFLVSDLDELKNYVQIKTDLLHDFLNRIWPAPVSIILELNGETSKKLKVPTAAFRIPNHKFCSVLLSRINSPLISTSVNKSGKHPVNDEKIILNEFGEELDAIFYSKNKSIFSASTLIDLTRDNPKLIREGAVKFESILRKFYT
ncbi:MAG: L-threonylcarbamoyladenylate synthase [Ignavibacteriales bacterium]|nr:L-threonylcarbamoyladenylate synthase [Ignavibacteriales bacterium]